MKHSLSKRILALLLTLVMVLSLIPMAAAEPAEDLTGKTVILHTNDTHGALLGFAQVAKVKADLEAKGANVLLVDAGDYSQGAPYVSLSKGESAITVMNAAGYDLATLGNHEFDYGWAQLKANLEKAEFQPIVADVIDEATGKSVYDGHVIKEVGGVKVGFFGMETPEASTKANPALIQGLIFPQEEEMYACAKAEVEALKAEGADLVIGLTHLGVDDESIPNRSIDLYAKVTGIDFIIDGHSHTVMTKGPNDEPIQSTGTKASDEALMNVGCIVIDNETKKIEKNELIPLGADAPKDPEVAAVAQEIMDAVNAEYDVVFAVSEVELNGDRAPGNRNMETNLGDLITDSMLWAVKKTGGLTVDDAHVVAVTNGGGIRAWIHAGDVTKKDVNTVLPFGNTVAVVYVSGAELLEALEASTYCTPTAVGGFPQVAGMKINIDTTKEFLQGAQYPGSTYYGPKAINRVTIDEVGGEPFDPDATYAVITNNFCAAGGDTYYAFAAATNQFDTGLPLDEVLMDYISTKLEGTITQEDYAEVQGRITFEERAGALEGKTVILHTNDTHGALLGFAQVADVKATLEAQGANVLLVDAGDYSQGAPYVSLSKGESAITVMNAAGYDIATLGNHEFDYGWPQLKSNLEKAEFQIIVADVIDEATGKSVYDGHVIKEVGGVKIGFFGMETPEAATKANPALLQGLIFPQEEEMYACAQAEVDALKIEGADLIIGITHLGVDDESIPNRSIDLLANVTDIDFIIDGHSHTVMTEGPDGEPIQSTGTKASDEALMNVGCIVIDNETKKIESNELIPLGADAPKDPEVAAVAQGIMDAVNAEYDVVFATSEVELNGDRAPGNRNMETNLGDLITDSMLWAVQKTGGLTVDENHVVAITNGGGIRAWIHAGDVTKKDVNTVLPFGNTVAVVYVTGAELLEALEASTYCTPTAVGGFPQVAGMKINIDTNKEFDQGEQYPGSTYYGPASINRVTIENVNGAKFNAKDTYAVITNNFCAAGGDTYYAFAAATNQFDTGLPLDEVLMDYITEELGGVIGQDYAEPQGRITEDFRFDDVKDPTKFYFEPVYWAYYHDPQITTGTSDTLFSPNKTCTRGQVVTFLWRAVGEPEPTVTTHNFTDVKETAYYYKAMLWAVENGVTTGTTDTTFSPNKDCTRGQVVTFMHRAAGEPEPSSTEHPFTDVKESGYYFKAMLWAVENGITAGTSATTFSPNKTATRGQVVTFLQRAAAFLEPEKPKADYVLFGWINGANYACEEDAENPGEYVFADGKLTATFTEDSYVAVKLADNSAWFMTDGWLGTEVTSATLYNTEITGENSNKLYVPGNVEVEFTLVENEDGTLTLSYAVKEPETTAIRVFETTDVHGYLLDASSGNEETFQYRMAYLAKIFNDARESDEYDDVLLLDGGDIYQGTPVSNLLQGRAIRAALDKMGYDAVALGNHEFDWGVTVNADAEGTIPAYEIGDYSGDPDIPVLAYNLFYADTNEPVVFTKDYTVVEKAGYRIAIIGYIPNYRGDIMAAEINPYVIDEDVTKLAAKIAEVNEAENPDVTILLAHESPKGLANAMDPNEVDLVVGGHSHSGTAGVANNGIPYIQGNCKAQGYASATILITGEPGAVESVTVEEPKYTGTTGRDNIPNLYDTEANAGNFDPVILDISHLAWEEVKDDMDEVLGYVDVSVDKTKVSDNGATVAGNWISGLMLRGTADLEPVAAFYNSGGIRTTFVIPEGETTRNITTADIYTINPFDNVWLVYELTGAEIAQQLLNGFINGNFGDQMSGLTFTYWQEGSGKNAERGIVSITLSDGTEIDPTDTETTYRVCTSNYSATLDGSVFLGKEPLVPIADAPVDNVTIIELLRAEGQANDGYLAVDTGIRGVRVERPVEHEYYLVGTMTDWAAADAYKLAEGENEGEFVLENVDLEAGAGVKVYDKIADIWYPDGMDNEFVVEEAGTYNLSFYPAGGQEGYYEGFFKLEKANGAVEFEFLVTSDLHGQIFATDYTQPYENSGTYSRGLTRVSTYIKEQREALDGNVYVVDMGDTFQGAPLTYYYAFNKPDVKDPAILAFRSIGYDMWVVGNHEFNYGLQILTRQMDYAVSEGDENEKQLTISLANYLKAETNSDESKDWATWRDVAPYVIKDFGGYKVAIIGFGNPNIPKWDVPANWEGIYFADIIETYQHYEAEMLEQADMIVVVAHSGIDSDPGSDFIRELVASTNTIAFAFSGHEHRNAITVVQNSDGKDVNILSPYTKARRIAQVKVTVEDGQPVIEPKLVNMENYPLDEDLVELLQPYETDVWENYMLQPIGMALGDYPAANLGTAPSAFMDLINTVQTWGAYDRGGVNTPDNPNDDTPAMLSISAPLTSGSNANLISEGAIMLGDMFGLYRFENWFYQITMNGEEVHQWLEFAATKIQVDNEGNPYVTSGDLTYYDVIMGDGFHYEIDVSKPEGERVVVITYNGEPVTAETQFTVVVNNYRYNGGGNYVSWLNSHGCEFLANDPDRIIYSTQFDMIQGEDEGQARALLVSYIKMMTEAEGGITPFITSDWIVRNGGEPEKPDYVLCGWINGAACADEDAWEEPSPYVFDEDGKLTAEFTEDSWIWVKFSDNSAGFKTDGYVENDTTAIFYNYNVYSDKDWNKMKVPAGTYDFTLVDNGDDSLTLSYAPAEEPLKLETTFPSATKADIDKYGDVHFSVSSADLAAAGFEYKDLVKLTFLDQEVIVPIIPQYRYVGAKAAGLVMWEDGTKPAEVEVFNGSFAATYGLADVVRDGSDYTVTPRPGVEFPVPVVIEMYEKQGYADTYAIFDLTRSNDREDYRGNTEPYPNLTDEEFANFRVVDTTGMGENKLYRSSSPINPSIGRNGYADAASATAGVKSFVNLADSAESAAKYAGYADTYYSQQEICFLNLGVDFTSELNRTGLVEAMDFLKDCPTPVLVHCNEGQDRAGFVSALLECLMGADYDEVVDDYMVTFYNYYGVQKGTDQYNQISNNIVKNLKTAFGVEDLAAANLAEEAEAYFLELGVPAETIAAVKVNLSGGGEPVEPDYVLFGYINGANYGCEDDYENPGEYVFVDGKLTAEFTEDSYVAVKFADNSAWFMTDGWLGTEVTSAILYNTETLGENANKLFVPGGVEVEFTLEENEDGTLTLSYTAEEEVLTTTFPSTDNADIEKYGNIFTSLNSADFFEAGFNWGDLVTVKFLEQELDLPVVPTYSYVDQGTAAVIVGKDGETGEPYGRVKMAINMGDFATTYGLAFKTTNADKTYYWTAMEGVEFPVPVTIEMKEKEGYLAELLLHDIVRTNNREDYPNLTDEEFANFRQITTTGMGDHLFRGSSPINPEIGRNAYADAALENAKVTVIMNLANDQATAEAYPDYAQTYYSEQNIIFLNLGVDFQAADFQAGLANGLRHFGSNPGVYYVHCTEGKDRAGFVSALLECLMGATYDEVVADYLKTYTNYYTVVDGVQQPLPEETLDAIANSNIIKTLQTAFGVDDLKTADLAAEAEEYITAIGLTAEELAALKTNLAGEYLPPEEPEYYLVGDMTGWEIQDDYMLTEGKNEGEFILENVALTANTGVKVKDSEGGWYPDPGDNYVVTEDGTYNVSFYPAGSQDGYHYGYFKLEVADSSLQFEVLPDGTNMLKYGHIDLNVPVADFLEEFALGDIVSVEVNGFEFDAPVVTNYDDVDTGAYLIRCANGKTVTTLAINYGQIGVAAGIIELAPEGSNPKYQLVEGLEWPMYATIVLKEAGGYADELSIRKLTRTNVRSDYDDLTDAEFANFRVVGTAGMGSNALYRTSSPIDPDLGRNTYADAAAAEAGVKTFINLADTEEEAQAFTGYADSYYSTQTKLFLALPVAFTSDEFKAGLANGYKFITTNDGPYLIHCLEGKDRTGLSVGVLECLMGATLAEIQADYLKTYENYFEVQNNEHIALTEAQVSYLKGIITKNLGIIFAVEDMTTADLAAEAEAYLTEIGLTADEIAALKVNLGKTWEVEQPPVQPDYYLVGDMTNWETQDAYKLTASETEGEFILENVALTASAGVKIKDGEGGWYPDPGDNYVVPEDGTYNVSFFPAGGQEGYHYGYFKLVKNEEQPPEPTGSFVKVTSTADLADGQYLIVYEANGYVLNAGLDPLDATSNYFEVTIEDGNIEAASDVLACAVTIDMTAGTIETATGCIGRTSDANGLEVGSGLTNTISIDGDGNAVILSTGGAYLRFNAASNQLRFRYFRSATYTNQKAVALYKLVEG